MLLQQYHSQKPNSSLDSTTGDQNSGFRSTRNSSIVIAKIGQSTLTIDEMSHSKILQLSSTTTLNKPMYRDDIFYSGSMKKVPEYAENVRAHFIDQIVIGFYAF